MARTRGSRAFGAGFVALVACTSAVPDADDEQVSSPQALLGGFSTDAPGFDAVGWIGLNVDHTSGYEHLCTGTLIAPESVLTSRRCALAVKEKLPSFLSTTPAIFSLGPDAMDPRRTVPVVDVTTFDELNLEVAVVHLDAPIVDVRPLRVEMVPDAPVGKSFAAIGYGDELTFERGGRFRRIGGVRVTATEAPSHKPTFERCGSPPPKPWGTSLLLADGASDEARFSPGDEGGPLIGMSSDGPVVFGVYQCSTAPKDATAIDLDGRTAVFAALYYDEVKELRTAMRWSDPCGTVPEKGVCHGTRLQRCVPGTTVRRVVTEECAYDGATCGPRRDIFGKVFDFFECTPVRL